VEEKSRRGIGGGVLPLALASALIVLLVVGVFVPLMNCRCGLPPSDGTGPDNGWFCLTCGNSGKISIYQSWKARRGRPGAFTLR
jgi:hypothetical protein